MCGICGRLNFDLEHPVARDVLRRMGDAIAHRGPDGAGEYVSGPVGLGHRRLSIIDLHTGDQPMSNEDGSVWVVYNGEIYNFEELRRELVAKGHRFKSTTDTEVIVHLYEEMGDRCVTRMRGMFAFALWDDRRKHLLLARDRVGVKPLYYARTGRSLVFGSEIKALLVDPDVEREVSARAVDRFLTYFYLPGSETLFEQVHKLLPGHYLTVDAGKVEIRQYWDLRFDSDAGAIPDFDTSVQALKSRLKDAVRDHMISDVPVGILLSGGADSTGVLRYAAECAPAPLHSFTLGFDGGGVEDERPYARLAARRYGSTHHEISMSADDFRDFLPRFVWHMEEPVCEPPAVALFFVSQLARDTGVKVLLSGEGGDEAFGGYPEYRNFLLLERLKSLFGRQRIALRTAIRLAARGSSRFDRYGDLVDRPLADYFLSRTATPSTGFNRIKGALYRPRMTASSSPPGSTDATRALFDAVSSQPPLNQMLYVDTKTWLPDDLLVKADKMTMAASVELRVPLLDHQVLEFAASLPASYKVDGWKLKVLLKAALRDSVPAEILRRKKRGFPVPYAHWLRNDLRDYVADTLLSSNAALNAWFSRSEVARIVESHRRGHDRSKEVFSLLVFELWLARFIGGTATSVRAAEAPAFRPAPAREPALSV